MKTLEDTDKMPSISNYEPKGAHLGKHMSDVPASYFHFLWTKCGFKDRTDTNPIAEYIQRNMNALQLEHPDGIWE